jgi:predicted amidohydrolase YtcJ
VAAEVARLTRLRERFGGGRLRVTAAKIFVDGVIEARTAALLAPYAGTADSGAATVAPARLDSLVVALDRAGFQVHAHAIGDRAVRMALDAFAAARAANGPRDARHTIAHLQLVDPADAPRFRLLGASANIQALWAWRDPYIRDLTEPVLDSARAARLYPFGTLARAGAAIVAGSDWPVTTMDPLPAMQVAVTRADPDAPPAPPWLPDELLTPARILAAYTIDGARLAFRERETGSIAPGKLADLVVLDRDPFAAPPHEIARARVRYTFVEGREVYAGGK